MNTIDAAFLNFAVPVIWERNERRVRVGKSTKTYQVNGVMHVDGNILLSDLEHVLPDHVLGKLKLNYTGDVPLSHPQEEELIGNMLRNAKAAHKVKHRYLYMIKNTPKRNMSSTVCKKGKGSFFF